MSEPCDELAKLIADVRLQGRIEGVISCTDAVGRFLDLIENGVLVGEDQIVEGLRKVRNGMSMVVSVATFDLDGEL